MNTKKMVSRSVAALGVSSVAITGLATGAMATGHNSASPAKLAQSCTKHKDDEAIAKKLGPKLHGYNLNGSISASQIACARDIISGVKSMHLDSHAAYIALLAAATESSLRDHHGGDRDSQGLFQMRQSMGWGNPEHTRNPRWATRKFLRVMLKKYPNNSWKTASAASVDQGVLISGPAAYGRNRQAVKVLRDALWSGTNTPTPPPTKPKPPKPPTKGSGKKVYKDVWAQAPSYTKPTKDGHKVGVLHKGRNYFFCQAKGKETSFSGYRNNWWLKTDDDSGHRNVWVNATHVSGGHNDGKIPGVPAC